MFVFKWVVVSILLFALLQQPIETSIFLGFLIALIDHALSENKVVVVKE